MVDVAHQMKTSVFIYLRNASTEAFSCEWDARQSEMVEVSICQLFGFKNDLPWPLHF